MRKSFPCIAVAFITLSVSTSILTAADSNKPLDAAGRQLQAAAKQLAAAERQKLAVKRQSTAFAAETNALDLSSATDVGSWDCDPLADDALHLLATTAATNGVSTELIRSVIDTESAGRPCAVSAKGAAGLMQLMPATAERFHLDDVFDPESNVRAGAIYLDELLVKYRGDVNLALAAYNAGPARVDTQGGIPDISETQQYVSNVLARLARRTSEKAIRTEAGSTIQNTPQPSAF
jgi:soluble lytic murein transglycosylase-like protein